MFKRIIRFEHGHNKRINEALSRCFSNNIHHVILSREFFSFFFPHHSCLLSWFSRDVTVLSKYGFSSDCRKPKHPPINPGANSPMNQSEFLAITCNFAANYFYKKRHDVRGKTSRDEQYIKSQR